MKGSESSSPSPSTLRPQVSKKSELISTTDTVVMKILNALPRPVHESALNLIGKLRYKPPSR